MDNDLDLEYERLLGEGAYGKVFLVKQQDGQKFAVKEMDLSRCNDADRDQALREATLLSQLQHKNILKYVESVICDDSLYIITEFCAGGDVDEYLQFLSKCSSQVPESVVAEWILHLGSALKYMHGKKILHRDMKTKNIFLMDDFTVKLGDLGIAKVLDLNQSKADTFIGTPSYMSPELFTGKSYNHKTDIWGLGCCAYEIMTLTRAFQGRALWTLIKEIKNDRKLELPKRYSLEIQALVHKMMSQDPAERPSAKDIVENDTLLQQQLEANDDIRKLPKPHQKVDNKQNVNISGRKVVCSGPSALKGALEQKNQSEEQKFQDSIVAICDKISTLKASRVDTTQTDTFVYKGDNDNDDELEATDTVLDGSLIQQYTEQLETLVDNHFGMTDSHSVLKGECIDSDLFTESSVGGVNHEAGLEDKDDDFDHTLIKQYSDTLEDEDSTNEDLVGVDAFVNSDKEPLPPAMKSLQTTEKYQYKGLKDTFALRPNKKWKKHNKADKDMFTPPEENCDWNVTKTTKECDASNSYQSNHVSASLTSQSSSEKTVDSNQVINTEPLSKMKICHNIELPSKNQNSKESYVKPVKPMIKQAVVDQLPINEDIILEHDVLNVGDIVSHLRHSVTPYTSVDEHSKMPGSQGPYDMCSNQESSTKSKKKSHFLKKQSQAKRSSETESATVNVLSTDNCKDKIKLYTRAQAVQFIKDDGDCEYDNMLVSAIGKDDLKKVTDVMCLVKDRQEMQ